MLDIKALTELCGKADAAGKAAVEKLKVIPMFVGQETHLFSNQIDTTKPVYFVEDGVCGFAWISIYPKHKGNTREGKAERKLLESCGFTKNNYEKTYQKWISAYNQSMQKKEAYARAFASVLSSNGLNAYACSRID
jgi:hypothetical protein